MVANYWSPNQIFMVAAVPPIIVVILLLVLRGRTSMRAPLRGTPWLHISARGEEAHGAVLRVQPIQVRGVFGLNCAGGMTPSRAPDRWRADWKDVVKVAQMADEAGIEFLLPIAKWHGLGGEANMWGPLFRDLHASGCAGCADEAHPASSLRRMSLW